MNLHRHIKAGIHTAADALKAHRTGLGTTDDVRRACRPLIAFYEALLGQITLRRLIQAQRQVREAATCAG